MAPPSLDPIQENVEKAEKSVNWLADVLRGRNPVKKLLLVDALLFAIFNPFSFSAIYKSIAGKEPPIWYGWLFWITVGLIFIAAVIFAYRVKQRESESLIDSRNERGAIKGLLPFGFEDAELFGRLQREDDFRECLPVLTDPQFRFGILCGESGCGKTSFLQASLWPRLTKQGHRCLYVKFTDLDPLDSIRLALIDQFKLPKEVVENADLPALLDAASQSSVILLFDQFEQFFVHHKRANQRKPFVQALGAWYRRQPPLPVKILICLRDDFAGRMAELQKEMKYSLGPQENIPLKKFEPVQATKIFHVIAETEQVSLDESFVNEFTQQELASRDDGLISPVDIQILAWMIAGRRSQEDRAFNRESFQKLGGIEGLLERFLSRALEARETESRRQAAIKVLLALTDLDGNARAGVLTLATLKEKLGGTAPDAEVTEALEWLTSAKVRLVNTIDDGYELAHERLIPALRRIAGKELSSADKANQLLDRRVNEWLGNNHASRYLLGWREWRLIERQRPYLVWGQQKAHKEALLSKTKRRWRIRLASIISPLLIVSLFGVGYLIWLNSEAGQIYQIKRDLSRLSEGIKDEEALSSIVESFIIADMSPQALQIAKGINDPSSRAHALDAIASTMAKVAVAKQSKELLEQAIEVTKTMDDTELLKVHALSACALAMAKIDDKRSAELFEQAKIEVRIGLHSNGERWGALSAIAEAMAKAAAAKQSTELFEQAIDTTKGIDFSDKGEALSAIVLQMVKIENEQAANLFRQVLEANASARRLGLDYSDFYNISTAMAKVAAAKQSTELFEQAIEVTKRIIKAPDFKVRALRNIAEAMAKVGMTKQSAEALEQAIETSKGIDDPYSKALALHPIAEAMARIDTKQSLELFRQAIEAANSAEKSSEKPNALRFIAAAMAKVAVVTRSTELFRQAIEIAKGINYPNYQADALGAITRAMAKVAVVKQDAGLLNQAIEISKGIDNPNLQATALSAIAEAAVKVKKLRLARDTALMNRDNNDKAIALSLVLKTWAKVVNPILVDENEEGPDEISDV